MPGLRTIGAKQKERKEIGKTTRPNLEKRFYGNRSGLVKKKKHNSQGNETVSADIVCPYCMHSLFENLFIAMLQALCCLESSYFIPQN